MSRPARQPIAAPPADAVTHAIRMLNLAVEGWRTAFARRHRLTPTDSVILTTLLANGGRLRPRDISEPLGITPGTLTAMLDRIEARAFISRVPHPTDRRSVYITLTDAGRDAMQHFYSQFAQGVSAAVPPEHREVYAELLLGTAAVVNQIVSDMKLDQEQAETPAG